MNRKYFSIWKILITTLKSIMVFVLGIFIIDSNFTYAQIDSGFSPENSKALLGSSERALIIVSRLENSAGRDFIYRNTQMISVDLAYQYLGKSYNHENIYALINKEATFSNFKNILLQFSQKTNIKKIDVLLHLHGEHFTSGSTIYFGKENRKVYVINKATKKVELKDEERGDLDRNELLDSIKNLNISNKLRMIYSSACYGADYAQYFVDAGFDCASGSIGINTNTVSEYPVFLKNWAKGIKFSECFDIDDYNISTKTWDNISKSFMCIVNKKGVYKISPKKVDSNKIFKGDKNITIDSF